MEMIYVSNWQQSSQPSVATCDRGISWPKWSFCDPFVILLWPFVILLWPFVTLCDLLWPFVILCDPFVTFVTFVTFCDLLWSFCDPFVTLCGPLWPFVTFCDLSDPCNRSWFFAWKLALTFFLFAWKLALTFHYK